MPIPNKKETSSSDSSSSSTEEDSSSVSSKASNDSSEDTSPDTSPKRSEVVIEDKNYFLNGTGVHFDLGLLKIRPTLLTAEELTSPDNEIWMITAPSSLDVKQLKGVELSLSKSSKFNVGKEKFETIIHKKSDTLAFCLPNSKNKIGLTSQEVLGTISIVKDVGLPKKQTTTLFQNKIAIQPPTDLKERHPIYGKDLEDVINHTPQKLKRKKGESTPVVEKRKKKKKYSDVL